MSWLTPLTGLILAASVIPPLLLLYFLKLRRRTQPIASTLLWMRSVEDLRANTPFQRLRANLLLLLQLIALLLLIASVMQPQIRAAGRAGGRTIFLIDNSMSMTATDVDEDGTTRLTEAKRRARDRVEAMYGGGLLAARPGETMIVAFSDRAEVVARFSRSKAELLEAIERIPSTHAATEISEALKLARAYTTNVDPESDRPVGDPATLEVFTDGGISDLDDQVLRGERMVYHRIGSPTSDNVAVGAISIDRPFDRPGAVEVFVGLLNYADEAVTCDVQLSVDTAARAVEEVDLPPARIEESTGRRLPGRKNLIFTPFDLGRGAPIEVAILRRDALMADNVAQIVAPPPRQLSVALVGSGNFVVRSALEGMPLARLELLTSAQFQTRATQGTVDQYDVVVLDVGATPPDPLPPGRYLSFGATPPVPGLNDFGVGERQVVLNTRDEHPVLRFVRLDDLFIDRCRLLQPEGSVDVLVEGSQGPVIVAASRGPLQLVHVAFDPIESSWPLMRSWVTFLFNAVDYLGHFGEALASRGFVPGEALTTRLPASASDLELRRPDGELVSLGLVDPTMLSWGPIRMSGLYVLSYAMPDANDRQQRAFAVNLLRPEEGDLPPAEQLEVGQETISGRAADASAYTPLWPWAIGFCLVVLMLEWWVYHRKAFL
ncbi:MAG: VWA domain-containing protein [Phycisphaerales bacterium]|nr:VWA domain-containing protein [Phycisphaerae bacterium]NNF44495.1 VWA domain-containing protein [Phycisphaerales bacterium]NNM26987.1 VWA domain-containing protein [Phycisphaerales bacterium]